MVVGKFLSGADDLKWVSAIRREVFEKELGVCEPKGAPDAFCMHALVFDGETPVGTGRILFDGNRFLIAGIAVLPAYRGQLYGDFLLRLLIDRAVMSNAQEICADVLESAVGFFEKLSFETFGERYETEGGVWCPMVLRTDRIHRCCDCIH